MFLFVCRASRDLLIVHNLSRAFKLCNRHRTCWLYVWGCWVLGIISFSRCILSLKSFADRPRVDDTNYAIISIFLYVCVSVCAVCLYVDQCVSSNQSMPVDAVI